MRASSPISNRSRRGEQTTAADLRLSSTIDTVAPSPAVGALLPLLPVPPARRHLQLPGSARVTALENGLRVALVANPQAPLVTTALLYRVGTRDEPPGRGGIAHFLEHMMFKGSAGYGPGQIDRLTQSLGGSNNAFTSHDATVYYFNFAHDRFHQGLAIEADRMRGLTLGAAEVDSERQVILEEIAMYESDPWDALDQRCQALFFGGHAYGRPVLGVAPELLATGPAELGEFHRAFYRPDNAVLVVAGDVGEGTLEAVAETLGRVAPGARPRPPLERPPRPTSLLRLTRCAGEVERFLLLLPAPPPGDADHAVLRLLVTVLGVGRSSRLQRVLVDEEQYLASVVVSLSENQGGGFLSIAGELVPGVSREQVEEALLRELAALRAAEPAAAEVERARRLLTADWVFDHERIHQQALTAAFDLAFFSLGESSRQLARALEVPAAELHRAARRYLDPEAGSVLGWSLPRPAE
jgi:zinc protease